MKKERKCTWRLAVLLAASAAAIVPTVALIAHFAAKNNDLRKDNSIMNVKTSKPHVATSRKKLERRKKQGFVPVREESPAPVTAPDTAVTPKKADSKKKKFVNPFLAWGILGGELLVAVIIALAVLLPLT